MPSADSADTAIQREHCFYCFDALLAHLDRQAAPKPCFLNASAKYPLFVTWNIVPAGRKTPRLRGCIGTFEAQPLADGLTDYAITSAVNDHRFNPITKAEVHRLECAVSLLTGFEECDDHLDWEIGQHGIYVHIPNPGAATSHSNGSALGNILGDKNTSHRDVLTATYLPDVIPEQGWTKVEAIDSAIRKAGWTGRITEEMRKSLRVQRYRSEKQAVFYEEYMAWKSMREN